MLRRAICLDIDESVLIDIDIAGGDTKGRIAGIIEEFKNCVYPHKVFHYYTFLTTT